MKRLIIFITILTIGCSTEKKPTDKNFADLTQDQKTELVGGLSDEFTGDFLKYSGQVTFKESTKTQTLETNISHGDK